MAVTRLLFLDATLRRSSFFLGRTETVLNGANVGRRNAASPQTDGSSGPRADVALISGRGDMRMQSRF